MDLVTKRHIIAKEKVTKTYKNVKFLPISLVVTEYMIIFALSKTRSLEMCITRQNM